MYDPTSSTVGGRDIEDWLLITSEANQRLGALYGLPVNSMGMLEGPGVAAIREHNRLLMEHMPKFVQIGFTEYMKQLDNPKSAHKREVLEEIMGSLASMSEEKIDQLVTVIKQLE